MVYNSSKAGSFLLEPCSGTLRHSRLSMAATNSNQPQVHLPLPFISLFAHEVRNPLNAVAAIGALLEREPKRDMLPWLGSSLIRQVGDLAFLVDLFLDGARLTTGNLKLSTEKVVVPSLVDDLLEDWRQVFEKGRIAVEKVYETDAVAVFADKARLRRALYALIQMRSRSLASGGLCRFSVRSIGPDVAITFEDSGERFTEDEVAAIESAPSTDLFSDAERGLKRLALMLVKAYVEGVGGGISLQQPGEGHSAGVALTLTFRGWQ